MRKIGIALVLILAAFFLSSCHSVSLVEKSRTISVQATGSLTVEPDTATLGVTVSELASTTSEAQQLANQKIDKLLQIALSLGIGEKDIKTTSLEFFPEYQWKDEEQVLVGQRVRQRLAIVVKELEKTLPSLIDQVATLNGVTMGQIAFSKGETADEYRISRTLAIQKAIEKASNYAEAVGMKLGKPLVINDYSAADAKNAPVAMMARSVAEGYSGAQVPTGTLDITSTVTVLFELL
ncbi:MAG: SIMPL domain-containing protein [Sphaerochaetaceae bacterium]